MSSVTLRMNGHRRLLWRRVDCHQRNLVSCMSCGLEFYPPITVVREALFVNTAIGFSNKTNNTSAQMTGAVFSVIVISSNKPYNVVIISLNFIFEIFSIHLNIYSNGNIPQNPPYLLKDF